MGLTGDNRPLNLTPTHRGLGWRPNNDDTSLKTRLEDASEPRDPLSPASPTQLSSPISMLTIPTTKYSQKHRLRSVDPLCATTDEHLFNLSIADSLGREPTTTASTKHLHRTAWSLLNRFQAAYREQSLVVAQMKADIEAAVAENHQQSKRAADLQRRLDTMAKKTLEQEGSMQELLLALSAEKKARVEENEQGMAPKKHSFPGEDGSLSLPSDTSAGGGLGRQDTSRISVPSLAGSILSEDLGVEGDQTDNESTAEEASIFSSRSRSPTIHSSMSMSTSEDAHQRPNSLSHRSSVGSSNNLAVQRTTTTLQSKVAHKLWKGFGGGDNASIPEVVSNCSNCQGQTASMAWDTVSLLRDENHDLKTRVTNLETAIDSALDAANGIATLVVSMNPRPGEPLVNE
ncbi:hypothetical protein BROUX41_000537 [Berkeleyomyces rouxiae]|uniref:uncharacterized protein n=1 Tax=Berkeleyomyces rouxiae TaxID=2035830 RepID=UPI003B76DD20